MRCAASRTEQIGASEGAAGEEEAAATAAVSPDWPPGSADFVRRPEGFVIASLLGRADSHIVRHPTDMPAPGRNVTRGWLIMS